MADPRPARIPCRGDRGHCAGLALYAGRCRNAAPVPDGRNPRSCADPHEPAGHALPAGPRSFDDLAASCSLLRPIAHKTRSHTQPHTSSRAGTGTTRQRELLSRPRLLVTGTKQGHPSLMRHECRESRCNAVGRTPDEEQGVTRPRQMYTGHDTREYVPPQER